MGLTGKACRPHFRWVKFSNRFAAPPALLLGLLVPAAAGAQVDLSPSQLQIDATEPNPTVRVTVTNAASAVSTQPPGLAVRLFEGLPSANVVLGNAATTTPLAPGQSQVLTFPLSSGYAFTLPNGVARSLYVRTDPDSAVAETNESNNENFAYRWREGLNPPVPLTHKVLVVTVQGPNYSAHGPQLASDITWAGGTVSHVYLNSNGVVANYLANNGPFDQLWVYDLSHTADNYPADWDAIAAWYLADSTRDIITDGRIIASLWNNQYLSEGKLIYENYYENLRVRRGGLVLGTDHGAGSSPTNGFGIFVDGINQINDRLGIGRFWGDPGGTYAGMPQVEPNPVRNIPNNLAIYRGGTTYGVLSNSSPGNCPTGFQDASNIAPGRTPLQRTFYTVAWHNGSTGGGAATPAISTTIQGSLGFNVSVNAPCRVPAPGQANVLTLNISTGAVAPLTYQWTSSLDGLVSTGPTLDTALLSAGNHTINVTVLDSTGFRPGHSVLVSVGGADCNATCIPDSEELAEGSGDTSPKNGVLDVCEDADGDGVTDPLDQAPCDPVVQAITYGPAQDVRGMLMYEDLWPGVTDLDFNDAVVAWNTSAQVDTAGRASKLRMTFTVLAVGGDLNNGLGVQLPVAASNVASVTRSVAGGAAQALALRAADSNATFFLSANMREFFGGQAGPINSIPGAPLAPVEVVVDVTLAQPTALSGAAPWDVYLFRTNDVTHQIHFPGYAGTAEMDGTLFGQTNDGSAPGRWFVDTTGLPYALALPELAAYPQEQVDIALLYPNIVAFAASGGVTNQDFYLSSVQWPYAYGGPVWSAPSLGPVPAPVIDTTCVVQAPAGLTLHLDAAYPQSAAPGSSTWNDLSGQGNHGVLTNGAAYTTSAGGAIRFDGVNDSVVKGKSAWTISTWVKVRQFNTGADLSPVLVSIGNSPSSGYYELFLEISPTTTWMAAGGALQSTSLTTATNTVYNYVWVLEGSTGRLYRNGALLATWGGMVPMSNVDGDLWLGRFKTSDYELDGELYQVQAYDRALSGAEIGANFDALRGRFGL
jgi:LruC domain-containing protein